jgi:hypothetical protein
MEMDDHFRPNKNGDSDDYVGWTGAWMPVIGD